MNENLNAMQSSLPKQHEDDTRLVADLLIENIELRNALEEIAYGPYGKSVAVKSIARNVLEKWKLKVTL